LRCPGSRSTHRRSRRRASTASSRPSASRTYCLIFERSLRTRTVIGIGATFVFGPLAERLVPQFVTLIRWQDIAFVFGVTVVMALLAGYIPVRRLAAIDPTSVFKA
jgi:ABC-type lipoprotein release transport system permease subunit